MDTYGDGQSGVCQSVPAFEIVYEDSVIVSLPPWDGDSVQSDPFVVSNDPGDCDLVVTGTVTTDFFPTETSIKVVVHATGDVIFETKPGDFTVPYETYTAEVTVCPQVEYRIILEDTWGDGQDTRDCDLPPPGKPVSGMIGTLDTGEVLFDAIGFWDGYELRETFVVP